MTKLVKQEYGGWLADQPVVTFFSLIWLIFFDIFLIFEDFFLGGGSPILKGGVADIKRENNIPGMFFSCKQYVV